MANNMGVPNTNEMLKYAHLHYTNGHSQFAPKGLNRYLLTRALCISPAPIPDKVHGAHTGH